MSYRFLALINGHGLQKDTTTSAEAALRDEGMTPCLTLDSIKVFVSSDTPTLTLPAGGIAIGDMFTEKGAPFSIERFPTFASCAQIRSYVLEHCWGEYLLILPEAAHPGGFSILRDPSGGVQCVCSLQDGRGFVTSDISVAMRAGIYHKAVDWTFIAECLEYPHLKAQRTGLVGVHELLPGFTLRVTAARAGTEEGWSPWNLVTAGARHRRLDEAAEDVRAAVTSVVRAWSTIDHSILVELSGGLDSSIVAAGLRGTSARVACCNLVTKVPGGDERQYAALVADSLGVELHVAELLPETAVIDFPVPADSVTPRIGLLQYASNELKERLGDHLNVDAFYTGGGGDVVFCYLRSAAPAADALRARGVTAGAAAIRDLSELHQCTHWKASRLTLRKLIRPPKPPCTADRSFLADAQVDGHSFHHPWFAAPRHARPGDRERIFDLVGTQVSRGRIPRAQRRRLRMPLLSQPVVEACLRAPSWMWIAGGQNRAVARYAFAGMLPNTVLARRSKGTLASYLGAVYARNKEPIRDFLLTGQLQAQGLLDTAALTGFFKRELPVRDQSFMRVLDLCMIENWVRRQS